MLAELFKKSGKYDKVLYIHKEEDYSIEFSYELTALSRFLITLLICALPTSLALFFVKKAKNKDNKLTDKQKDQALSLAPTQEEETTPIE